MVDSARVRVWLNFPSAGSPYTVVRLRQRRRPPRPVPSTILEVLPVAVTTANLRRTLSNLPPRPLS